MTAVTETGQASPHGHISGNSRPRDNYTSVTTLPSLKPSWLWYVSVMRPRGLAARARSRRSASTPKRTWLRRALGLPTSAEARVLRRSGPAPECPALVRDAPP